MIRSFRKVPAKSPGEPYLSLDHFFSPIKKWNSLKEPEFAHEDEKKGKENE
jgi:hypothetical protein